MIAKHLLSLFVVATLWTLGQASNYALAPAAGTACDADPEVCTVDGSSCGYYTQCLKCVCNNPTDVSAQVDSVDKCLAGNVKVGQSCEDDSQCADGACLGDPKVCKCPDATPKANDEGTGCIKANAVGDPCPASTSCAAGFFCDGSSTCQQCIANCVECSDASTCTTCAAKWKKNGDGTACEACTIDNCGKCDDNIDECDATDGCMEGYFRTDATNCDACDPSCKTCTAAGSATACGTCPTGSYLTNTDECKAVIMTADTTCAGDEAAAADPECWDPSTKLACDSGTSKCKCAADHTWKEVAGTWLCLSDDASITEAAEAECSHDTTNILAAIDSTNDASVKVCVAGLRCITGCGAASDKNYCVTQVALGGGAGRVMTDLAVSIVSIAMAAFFW